MANRFPLQAGDVAPDYSDNRFDSGADRRAPEVTIAQSNPQYSQGENMTPDQDRPEGRLWKVGQAEPESRHSAPFPVIMMDGDNNGYPAEVHEIDIYSYGDAYDPTAPMRVRSVAPPENHWELDSDRDGHRN